ncbi:MAG TPA: radical SAM protein, partial [Mycobacterium sp.]|nr:radical SAM protein [Mycobacterium sp.]
MRWDHQAVTADDGALPGLNRIGFVRSVRTPQFEGITFHEVLCKSALNKIPAATMLPFEYTVNGYRGCSHACRYCFARPTHEYLDLDSGTDFDTQIVVKTNVAEVLRRELRRKSWRQKTVALGTNTDPYQRAEGRYALMPGIISALADFGTGLSILTKGTLLRRDLPLIADAATHVPVTVSVSLAVGDPQLHKEVEPGTPGPQARLG